MRGTKAIRLLLNGGAAVECTNDEGLSPLSKAERENATRVAALIQRYLAKRRGPI